MKHFLCRHFSLLFALSSVVGHTACPACVPAQITKPVSRKKRQYSWVVDSGATIHCVNDFSLLTSVYTDHDPVNIKVADKRTLRAHAVGTAIVNMTDRNGKTHQLTLHNVVYHPSFHTNLLSVRRLWKDNRISTVFKSKNYLKCMHTHAKFPFSYHKSYCTHTACATTASKSLDADLLHSRFGHCSMRRLRKLIDRSSRAPTCAHYDHDPHDCDACKAGGSRRKPHSKRRAPTSFTYFGERLSSDLCGPFTKSVDGNCRYLLNIVDSHTNELFIYPLRSKSSTDVLEAFQSFLKEQQQFLPTDKPITWHTDNGGEFMSSDIHVFCHEFAIIRSFSVPFDPPQNAHAERMWGILLRTMRIMLAESHVHESFWTYAARHACMLHNVLPSTKLAGEISPYQAKYKVPPRVDNIRVWGCTCWYHLHDHERDSKLSPRAVPAIHLGVDTQRHGHIIYVPYLNRITSAYHLSFQERKFLKFDEDGIRNLPRNVKPLRDETNLYRDSSHPNNTSVENHSDNDDNLSSDDDPHERCPHPECTLPKHHDSIPHSHEQRATRDRGRSPRLVNHHNSYHTYDVILEDVNHYLLSISPDDMISAVPTPNSYDEAMRSKLAHRWKESMNKEITDLLAHDTWELVKRNSVPKSRRITKSKWVYKIKLNKDGSIERFKSRFVVCGYSQVKGLDYFHSFSATMRATSMRILLALASGEKLKLEHFDVTNAFTQSDIDSEIYVDPPKGYEKIDKDGNPYVLKLKKSLYGTKQASRLWQLKLRSHLTNNMGFTNSTHDPCLFSRRWDDGSVILCGVYVDDIVVAHKGDKLKWFTTAFTGPTGFRAKHVGPLSWFLGMSVEQGSDYSVTISQDQYITKLLEKFVPTREASVIRHAMPCNPLKFQKLATSKDDIEREKVKSLPYLQLIGSLLYLTMTRPDICFYCSTLCSFMHDPSVECYYAAIDLLLYVANTRQSSLTFSGSVSSPLGVDQKLHSSINTSGGLIAYSDASWRKPDSLGYSMFGYVVYLFGAPVSFAAKNLRIVALSSAEAEYAAAAYTCKEVSFIRKILTDLGHKINGPVVMCVDNQAAIKIAENVGVTGRTKHFVDTIHYFRHLVEHNVIVPTFVRTNHQRADGMTKPLGKTNFREWCRSLMNFRIND